MTHSEVRQHPLGYWEAVEKPSAATLEAFYAEKYFQTGQGNYRAAYSPEELRYIVAKISQRWEQVRAIRGDTPGRMLDVGCGEGFALSFFRDLGWSVEGLDYSSAGIGRMNPDCLPHVTIGDMMALLHERIGEGRRYDLIWLTNVLEHVPDPPALLGTLGEIAGGNGVLVVTVPNDFSTHQRTLLAAGCIEEPFWVHLPDHLAYFDRDSLGRTAEATGWQCREILADFPIDWFLLHPGSNYVHNPALGKAAHAARVLFENALATLPPREVNAFYSAMAKVGMGRQLTAFLAHDGDPA